MPIHVEISSNNNDAFAEDLRGEMIRALYETALKLEDGRSETFKVYDSNGNPCGKVVFSDD